MHAHEALGDPRRASRLCARGCAGARPRPRGVAVRVILQLDGGALGVGVCVRAYIRSGRGVSREGRGRGKKGGERVREESVDLWCVEDWLRRTGTPGDKRLGLKPCEGVYIRGQCYQGSEPPLCREAVVSGAADPRERRNPGETHGVTSVSFPARKGSSTQRSGIFCLSRGKPIYIRWRMVKQFTRSIERDE